MIEELLREILKAIKYQTEFLNELLIIAQKNDVTPDVSVSRQAELSRKRQQKYRLKLKLEEELKNRESDV